MSDPKRVVKLAKQFREVLDVAEDLAKIGDLEQAKRNAETGTAKAQKEMQVVIEEKGTEQSRLYDVKCDLKLAEKRAEDTIALAKQAAQEIIADAKEEAGIVVRTALEQERLVADRVLEDQERHAASMRGFAEAEGVARAKVDTIEAELDDLRERIG